MFTDFNYDSEISKELAQTVSKYLIDNSNFQAHYHSIKNNTVDALIHWEAYAELGWLLAPSREENNGIGCTSYDLACMQVEMGKHLVLEPFTTHCLAVQLIESSDNSTLKETVLPLMLTGENLCAFAIFERACRYSLNTIETEFKQNKNGSFNISGVKHYVNDIQNVTHILVLARNNQNSEKCWFCIPVNQPGISFNFYLGTDDKPMADLTLDVRELDSKFKISLNTADLPLCQTICRV
jgi:alkylation response protein AidB-like acyl-CoA dehydrogenase